VRPRLFPSPSQASGKKKPKTEFERFDALAKKIFKNSRKNKLEDKPRNQ
jgi:hypothetical protein